VEGAAGLAVARADGRAALVGLGACVGAKDARELVALVVCDVAGAPDAAAAAPSRRPQTTATAMVTTAIAAATRARSTRGVRREGIRARGSGRWAQAAHAPELPVLSAMVHGRMLGSRGRPPPSRPPRWSASSRACDAWPDGLPTASRSA